MVLVGAIVAVMIAGFSLRESRKKSKLIESIAESMKFIASKSRRKKSATDKETEKRKIELKERTEERRRLQAQLQEQKQHYQRQKDLAKALGWLYDRISEADDYDD